MADASHNVKSLMCRVAGVLLTGCAAIAACAAAPGGSVRIIATLAPGVSLDDHGAFERRVFDRSATKVVYGGAVSGRVHAFTVRCDAADAGCVRAKEALMRSGLFASISDDRRRSGY